MTTGITCDALTKDYDGHRAVDDLSFRAPAGALTGFIGVNGAGKTTTIRTLLGLVRPTSGRALIDGRPFRALDWPRRRVGAVLDVPGAHPGHSGRAHLDILALASGLPRSRTDEVLERVELTGAANARVGTYSLGMRQRLALAAALLGDPPVLVLDEPTKGLDPAGIRWLRDLLRDMTDEGRCVLMSSHQLSELAAIADRVVMIERGRLVSDGPTAELLRTRGGAVLADTPSAEALMSAVTAAGGHAVREGAQRLRIEGLAAAAVGELAARAQIPVHRLDTARTELEDVFFDLTATTAEEARDADHRQ